MRKGSPNSSRDTLRDALYDMIHGSAIPAKVQAEELNIGYSYLCNAANADLPGFEYQLRLIIPHTRLTRNFAALDYIERQLGRVGVPVSPLDCVADGLSCQALAKAMLVTTKEMGEAAAAANRALADGKLRSGEIARCKKELWDLIQQAAATYRGLSALEDAEA